MKGGETKKQRKQTEKISTGSNRQQKNATTVPFVVRLSFRGTALRHFERTIFVSVRRRLTMGTLRAVAAEGLIAHVETHSAVTLPCWRFHVFRRDTQEWKEKKQKNRREKKTKQKPNKKRRQEKRLLHHLHDNTARFSRHVLFCIPPVSACLPACLP